jgi:hypothetical protein
MRRRPNPHRVLAHAIECGDTRLAALLAARLLTAPRRPGAGPDRVVERLVRALRL